MPSSRLLAPLLAALTLAACGADAGGDVTATGGTVPLPPATSTTLVEVATTLPPAPAPTADASPADATAAAAADGPTLWSLVEGSSADEVLSSRFEAQIRVEGIPELDGPLALGLSGATSADGDAQLVLDLAGLAALADAGGAEAGGAEADGASGGEPFPPELGALLGEPVEVVTVDGTTWLRMPGFAELLGSPTPWIEIAPELAGDLGGTGGAGGTGDPTSPFGTGDPLSPFGATTPEDLLELLGDVDAPLEVVGTEVVRGTDTTRYRSQVDLDELLAPLFGAIAPDAGAGFEQAEGEMAATVEVWVDAEGRFRKFAVLVDVEDPATPLTVTVLVEVYDHGQVPPIAPPPAEQVTPLEDLDLEALLGFVTTA